MASAGILGLGWASCGGESAARLGERCVAVDGIQNVIRMLEEIEDANCRRPILLRVKPPAPRGAWGCLM